MKFLRLLVILLAASALWAQALKITDPPDGAILNRHDGRVESNQLWITVKGETRAKSVLVNGRKANVSAGRFEASVPVQSHETKLVAKDESGSDAITVLWDGNSAKRYRFSVDDNVKFLADIAQHSSTYKSIFDNPYLAFWREMHGKYGTKVHFNIYYETRGFNLSQMPEKYKPEWQANRDWIRLTFHARANEPDRPYLTAAAEKVIEDYRLVTKEIERFAGKELLSSTTTIHWGEATREACKALRAEGVKTLAGYFEFRDGAPRVSYYLSPERVTYLSGRDYWKDTTLDLLFVRHDIVINGVPLAEVEPRLEKLAADPHQSEVLELMIHEQHYYPGWRGYAPDYKERVERAIAWATSRKYRPVFFEEGFLGSPLKRP